METATENNHTLLEATDKLEELLTGFSAIKGTLILFHSFIKNEEEIQSGSFPEEDFASISETAFQAAESLKSLTKYLREVRESICILKKGM